MTDTSHTSESTATPSGFLTHELGYEDGDDFSNMFSGLGPEAKRPPAVMESPASVRSLPLSRRCTLTRM